MYQSIAEAWGTWLDEFSWDLWCTLTFKEERSHASATRAFENFGKFIRNSGSPDAGWFFAHEVGRLGRLHLHALIGGIDPWTSRRALWRWWFRRYGRAQILPFDPDRGAAFYVAKYVTKGELSHYDIEPPTGRQGRLWTTPPGQTNATPSGGES